MGQCGLFAPPRLAVAELTIAVLRRCAGSKPAGFPGTEQNIQRTASLLGVWSGVVWSGLSDLDPVDVDPAVIP